MSGRYKFEIYEGIPILPNIEINGELTAFTWQNCTLFTHAKEYEQVDHIWLNDDEEAEQAIGAYVFRLMLPDFQDLLNGLRVHDYPEIHKPIPTENDMIQYDAARKLYTVEARVIEETEDDEVVRKAMANWDAEYRYYCEE